MKFAERGDDPEDEQRNQAQRAAAASRSTWVGVGMLWSAFRKLEEPGVVQAVHVAALWVAGGALIAKELPFRYMLAGAKRVKSSLLVTKAWHARSDRGCACCSVIACSM